MRLTASPIAASALGLLVLAATPSPAGDLRGYSADAAKAQREWETKFRAIPSPDSLREYMRRLSARPHHVGSPYDKANAEWILEVQELRARRADRVVRRAVPHAEGARGGARGAEQVRGQAPGAAGRGRPDVEPAGRTAANVQRLLGRRRRDRAPRVREFRRPGGLRAARAARRIGEGRDRDRALLRLVARHQAQGRGRARRRGLPHLLGPERGRLHPW